jgi:hypothetical protein
MFRKKWSFYFIKGMPDWLFPWKSGKPEVSIFQSRASDLRNFQPLYCLIKTCIDLVSLLFSNEIYKKNHVNSISIRPMDIKVSFGSVTNFLLAQKKNFGPVDGWLSFQALPIAYVGHDDYLFILKSC